jgi:regulator of sigma E protease
MEILSNLKAFVIVLGIIIFVHEFGHFITAKLFGMRVFIFSFGFGKRLLGFKWGDTDCRLSLVPLGWYVKLEGEPDDHLSESQQVAALSDGEMVRVDNPNYFTNRPRWQRILVYLAGPAMNVVLTVVVMTVLYMSGVGGVLEGTLYDRPVIGMVEAGSGAATAGILPGDEIAAIDGAKVPTWEDALYKIALRPDTTVRLRMLRAGSESDIEVQSTSMGREKAGTIGVFPLVRVGQLSPGAPAEQAGVKTDDGILAVGGQSLRTFADIPPIVARFAGKPLDLRLLRDGRVLDLTLTPRTIEGAPRIGIAPKTVVRQFGFFRSVKESIRWTWGQTKLTIETIQRLLTGGLSPQSMMGPLGIAKASGSTAREGLSPFFFLIAMISIQVGILNLFPLAPLDGGHLAILLVESAVRRDFSETVKAWVLNAGALVIFGLIGVVLYSDFSKTWLGKYLP